MKNITDRSIDALYDSIFLGIAPEVAALLHNVPFDREEKKNMKVKDIIKAHIDSVSDYTILKSKFGTKSFHTDSIHFVDSNEEKQFFGAEAKDFAIMDEDEFNRTVFANVSSEADFDEFYDDKNAKVLVILV